jgi:hypothetical protein
MCVQHTDDNCCHSLYSSATDQNRRVVLISLRNRSGQSEAFLRVRRPKMTVDIFSRSRFAAAAHTADTFGRPKLL